MQQKKNGLCVFLLYGVKFIVKHEFFEVSILMPVDNLLLIGRSFFL